MRKHFIPLLFICFITSKYTAQVITREDSLNAGLIASKSATVISGYGSFKYANNLKDKSASINVDRVIIFIGHKFNNKISFFSELEIEDAKIEGGAVGGEFALEQAFIKFNINRNNYISVGLIIPRIGIINENHLPTTFNGNERTMVEKYIIPATWRELGLSLYGYSNKIAGLNYSLALVNGLSSANFEAGNGIRGGRYEGSNANASSLAVTGSLLYYRGNFRSQISSYFGGSAGISKTVADSLMLNNGVFGTGVSLSEFNIQYLGNRFQAKTLVTFVQIPSAEKINTAYNNNTPEKMLGSYLELAYNLVKTEERTFRIFSRYEFLDMNYSMARKSNSSMIKQHYLISGFSYLPVNGVIIKLDYTYQLNQNQSLVNPMQSINGHFIKLGLGYSF